MPPRPPYRAENLFVCEYLARALGKRPQDFVLLRRKVHLSAVRPNATMQQVDLEIVAHELRRLAALPRSPAQGVFHARQDLSRAKRFPHIVVCTIVQRADESVLVSADR